MTLFLQYVVSGLATGCTFALVATGFVAIYRVTQVVNFAQGAFAVIAGMAAASFLHRGVPHVASEALAILVAAAAGLVVGLIAIGRRGTPPLVSLIITLGLGIGAYAVIILLWGDQPVSFGGLPGQIRVGGVGVQVQFVLVVVVTALAYGGLAFFFGRTYLGKALTACSSNPRAARLLGIDTRVMGLVAFTLGGALGGLAGVLLTPLQPVSFDSDVSIAINGFAAAIFGGILRPALALVGGLVLGVSEALVAGYSQASFQSGVALVLMLALMIWQTGRRPAALEEQAG
ncbi:MAG: branched-chain amino acid ABC transporter permease [Candidatus Dormibacteraeota bacterium]|nr:branched-chain amino acid ABC transporter permease [Candidatus Dormibacteraeota bacterium]MBO0759676.1 branched-chain amino acid ABC transporter permease [Candidatus Dormibacteraeota bacterium]